MKNLKSIITIESNNIVRLVLQEFQFWGYRDPEHAGMFVVRSNEDKGDLRIMATNGDGWDHLSVSRIDRCPTWPEMEQVKRIFFKDDEDAFELHMNVNSHISMHPYTLHIWKCHNQEIPIPPSIMV